MGESCRKRGSPGLLIGAACLARAALRRAQLDGLDDRRTRRLLTPADSTADVCMHANHAASSCCARAAVPSLLSFAALPAQNRRLQCLTPFYSKPGTIFE